MRTILFYGGKVLSTPKYQPLSICTPLHELGLGIDENSIRPYQLAHPNIRHYYTPVSALDGVPV